MARFKPSNADEAMSFDWNWCSRCQREKTWRERGVNPCKISTAAILLDDDDPNYPVEWVYDDIPGKRVIETARCTAFVREVAEDDNADGGEVKDPRQLELFGDQPLHLYVLFKRSGASRD
jgi:hypothetical protein